MLVCLLATAARAAAQSDAQIENRFAIGGEFKVKTSDRASQEDYARGQLGPGLLWRFGKSKAGWGFHWGLNWYAVKLERPIGGSVTELGELNIRPLMAGWGYTYLVHRYAITADVLGGYAVGGFTLSDPAIDAYRRTLGVTDVTTKSTNTLVLKPEIGVWYDVNKKIYVNLNAGYMLARPDVTVETSAGNFTRKARADQFIL
ncbi:MAG: outer membrane beta-barrel protein, partial [Vicinamibacterales bacterium]